MESHTRDLITIRQLSRVLILIVIGIVVCSSHVLAQSADELYRKAVHQFREEQYRKSRNTYKQFTESFPNDSRYWDAQFGLAQSHLKLNNFERANRKFAAVRKNHDDRSIRGDALFAQIQIAIMQDKVALARALSETFLNIHPDHVLRASVKEQLKLLNEMNRSSNQDEPHSRSEAQRASSKSNPASSSSDTEAESMSRMDSSPSSENRRPSQEISGEPKNQTSFQEIASSPQRILPEIKPPSLRSRKIRSGDDNGSPNSSSNSSSQSVGEADSIIQSPDPNQRKGKPDSTSIPGSNSLRDLSRLERALKRQESTLNSQTEQLRNIRARIRDLSQNQDTIARRGRSLQERSSRLRNQLQGDTKNIELEDTSPSRPTSANQRTDVLQSLPDTPSTATSSDLKSMRNRAQNLLTQGNYRHSREVNNQILRKNPNPRDFYRAYQIESRLRGSDTGPHIKYLNRALNMSNPPEPEFINQKASVLLENERPDDFESLIRQYSQMMSSTGRPNQKARWFYTIGRYSHEKGQSNEAFFQLMKAIRAAPNSRWARKARTLIQEEL